MKKLLCAILAMALVILPVGGSMVAYAEEAEVPATAFASSSVTATGTYGTVTWTLYDDGELNIAPTSGN